MYFSFRTHFKWRAAYKGVIKPSLTLYKDVTNHLEQYVILYKGFINVA